MVCRGKQINKRVMTEMWEWPSANKGYPRLCRSQNPALHSGPLDPECCSLSPLLQLLPPILTLSPPLFFPFLPYSMCALGSHASCLSWDLCTLSSLCQEPLTHSSSHVASFSLSSQLQWHFSESSYTVHWPVALNFLHPCIFIISLLRHFKCVIVDHP